MLNWLVKIKKVLSLSHTDKNSWYSYHYSSLMKSNQALNRAILCLIPRTTVTSLSASKDTRCKTHPLSVNPGVPFWTCEKLHKLRARWHASSSEYTCDITVVLEVRQSIVGETVQESIQIGARIYGFSNTTDSPFWGEPRPENHMNRCVT